MRFLHVADLHIGKQVDGIPMVKEDQPFVLEQVLRMLEVERADALVLAGDIYDKASPSEEAVRLFDWFLTKVSAMGIPCLAVPGNHDSSDRLAFARQMLKKQGIFFPSQFDGSVEKVELTDEHGHVNFWLLPYIRPVDVRRFLPEAHIENDYTTAVKAVLDCCEIDVSQRNILIAHQFVTSGSTQPDRASEEFTLGGLDNVDVSAFADFDYVALGHIHRPQRIGRDTVRYAGSPLKYSIGETRFDKSAVLVSISDKPGESPIGECIRFELEPFTPLHEMREIKGPLDVLVSQEVIEKGSVSDYVHVILTDEGRRLDAVEKIRTSYPNFMGIEYESDLNRDARAIPEAFADPKDFDPAEIFATFFEQHAGKPLSDRQAQLAQNCLQKTLADAQGGWR